jgi:transposase
MEAELERLRGKLRYQERTAKEGPFGPSTPSSKIPVKPSSLEERQNRKGGARPGHPGRGRQVFTPAEADRVERVQAADTCPDCGTALALHALRRRPVVDVIPLRVEKQVFELERKRCPACQRRVDAKPPGVLPRFLYGNALLAHVAAQHYLYGQTLGSVARQMGLSFSSLLQAMHALGRRLEPVIPKLVEEYRRAPVKHADETGWRTDGRNGYAWLFATTRVSLFRFRGSRAAAVSWSSIVTTPTTRRGSSCSTASLISCAT